MNFYDSGSVVTQGVKCTIFAGMHFEMLKHKVEHGEEPHQEIPAQSKENTPQATTSISEICSATNATPKTSRGSTCEDSSKTNDTPIRLTPSREFIYIQKIRPEVCVHKKCPMHSQHSSEFTNCLYIRAYIIHFQYPIVCACLFGRGEEFIDKILEMVSRLYETVEDMKKPTQGSTHMTLEL